MKKCSCGQSSIEFLALISLVTLMIASLYSAINIKNQQTLEYQNSRKAQMIAEYFSFQMEMALVQGRGYSRNFSLPESIGGQNYVINVYSNSTQLSWRDTSVITSNHYRGESLTLGIDDSNKITVENEKGNINVYKQ